MVDRIMEQDQLRGVTRVCLDAGGPGHGPVFPLLRRVGHVLRHVPLLGRIVPVARRALSVSEPAGSVSFQAEPAAAARPDGSRPLTVLSANLWHDWPWQRRSRERLERFARLVEVEEADVLLLQEIARTRRLRVDEWLAKRLGMAYAYSRANGHADAGFEEGLGVYSRFPLRSPRLRDLGYAPTPLVRRIALGATLDTPFGPLLVFSVHLGICRRGNAAQVSRLQGWIAEQSGDSLTLIGGDFNADERSPQMRSAGRLWVDAFRHLHPGAEAGTHEWRWPCMDKVYRRRLDYIFLRPGDRCWNVVDARHVDGPDGPHSDHRAVLVRLIPAE